MGAITDAEYQQSALQRFGPEVQVEGEVLRVDGAAWVQCWIRIPNDEVEGDGWPSPESRGTPAGRAALSETRT